jgi:hypothetical protein
LFVVLSDKQIVCITQSYILNYPQPCIFSVDLLFLWMDCSLLSFVILDLDFTLSYSCRLILILYVASRVNVWGWLLCTNAVMFQWFSIILLTVWPHNGNWIEGSSSPSMLLFCWGIIVTLFYTSVLAMLVTLFLTTRLLVFWLGSLTMLEMLKMQFGVVMVTTLMVVD